MIKDTVKYLMESLTDIPVFYQRADVETEYPFLVFEYRRLTTSDGRENYVLEVNAWDMHKTSSRIEAEMNSLENGLHKSVTNDKERTIVIYKDSIQPVDDENKEIKRIRAQFEMQIFERRSI